MVIKRIPFDFTICKAADYSRVDWSQPFVFACKTDEENSLVCLSDSVPENALICDDGWRAFRIEGTLDFSLIGILSRLSALLAENGIGIFAVSTYNTDYILTKQENLERAMEVLARNGYEII